MKRIDRDDVFMLILTSPIWITISVGILSIFAALFGFI